MEGKIKVFFLNVIDSEELISEENIEDSYNTVVKNMRNEITTMFGDNITFVNDLMIHKKPRPLNNIKIAVCKQLDQLKAFVYN